MFDLMDNYDREILRALQIDADQSVDSLADKVNLSRNACWRRVKQLEATGIIKGRVALVDAEAVDLGLTVMVLVRTNQHAADWADKFRKAVHAMPEITGAYRMSGDLDYVLRVRVRDVKSYDAFYQRLTTRLRLSDISASFVMEEIKDTTALPL
ncbi:MAG: AsnC family transcriptional regulator [Rhizobiaceae bacterium]|nr:AsnC family transcriptional regulator [Rhizobiaceae bacterium]